MKITIATLLILGFSASTANAVITIPQITLPTQEAYDPSSSPSADPLTQPAINCSNPMAAMLGGAACVALGVAPEPLLNGGSSTDPVSGSSK